MIRLCKKRKRATVKQTHEVSLSLRENVLVTCAIVVWCPFNIISLSAAKTPLEIKDDSAMSQNVSSNDDILPCFSFHFQRNTKTNCREEWRRGR